MVVGIHTFIPYTIDTPLGVFNAFVRQILNCAVPIFLALSGYFLGAKDLNTIDSIKGFWKKQIPKVYIPALIWSLPYFATILFNNISGGGRKCCISDSYPRGLRV